MTEVGLIHSLVQAARTHCLQYDSALARSFAKNFQHIARKTATSIVQSKPRLPWAKYKSVLTTLTFISLGISFRQCLFASANEPASPTTASLNGLDDVPVGDKKHSRPQGPG